MIFLAILKDSFREAIDVKLFSVLVGGSLALGLVFASLTFTPRPARELLCGLSRATVEGSLIQAPAPKDGGSLQLRGVEPCDGAPDRPSSPLRFTVLAQFAAADNAALARRDPGPIVQIIRQHFGRIGTQPAFEVSDVDVARPDDPSLPAPPTDRQVYFEVITRPTDETLRIWPHDCSLLFGALPLSGVWPFLGQAVAPAHGDVDQDKDEAPPLGVQVFTFEDLLVRRFGSWVAVLVSVLVTAFFIPNMLQKGTVDLLLVKPIRRWRLLVYKYVGGLTFIFLNATLAVGCVWLALGLRSGIWCHRLLLLVPVLTFAFAVFYAVSSLAGVLSRSPIVAILITCLVWAFLFGVGEAHLYFREQAATGAEAVQLAGTPEGMTAAVIDVVHYLLPRTTDLDALTDDLLERDLMPQLVADQRSRHGPPLAWGESLTVSAAFIAVMLGLACLRFATKDY